MCWWGEPEGDRWATTNNCLPLVMVDVVVAVVALVVPARGDAVAAAKEAALCKVFVPAAAVFPFNTTSGDICKLRYRTLLTIIESIRK